jgi:hypothetical protein
MTGDTPWQDLAPGDRGTEVRVQFLPRWFGRRSPARVQELLRQFKQMAETGEIARVETLLVGGAQ